MFFVAISNMARYHKAVDNVVDVMVLLYNTSISYNKQSPLSHH